MLLQSLTLKVVAPDKKVLEAPGTAVPKTQRPEKVKADAATITSLDEDREKASQAATKDLQTPNRNSQKALTAYRDIELADKRSEIQSLVGVNLFV
jgi:hypothetical protein